MNHWHLFIISLAIGLVCSVLFWRWWGWQYGVGNVVLYAAAYGLGRLRRPSHVRGSISQGVVAADYSVKAKSS